MFIEKSSVDVFEEVVVDDVADASELVEEEVSARRRRASGIGKVVAGLDYVDYMCFMVALLRRLCL